MNPKGLVAALLVCCAPARPPMPTEASPGVVFPHHVAEGKGGGAPPGSEPTAASPPAAPSAAPAASAGTPRPSPPDPEPLRMPQQYELELRYERGRIDVTRVRAMKFRQPVVTARRIGRFALELWIGQELIDRVRFDFPLLGVEEPKAGSKRPLHEAPSFSGKLAVTVLVPASPRVRRFVVLDRATGEETELSWPPVTTTAPTPSSAAPTPSSAAPTPSSSGAGPQAGSRLDRVALRALHVAETRLDGLSPVAPSPLKSPMLAIDRVP
jgi:hypothetical protein